MKTTPKSIAKICEILNASYSMIRYRHAAAGVYDSRKGYSFVSNVTGFEILEVQPVHYSNGDKWLITGEATISTTMYAKNTADIAKRLPASLKTNDINGDTARWAAHLIYTI